MMKNSVRVSLDCLKRNGKETARKGGYRNILANLVTGLPIFIIWLLNNNNISSNNNKTKCYEVHFNGK